MDTAGDTTAGLIAALGARTGRRELARGLAPRLGADAIYFFVPHPDRAGAMIPAPGCEPTVPGPLGWRELLARCVEPGSHAADVAYPTASATTPAVAHAFADLAIVLVGRGVDAVESRASFAPFAPLLAAVFHAEARELGARADLRLAHQSAERAAALTAALELARRDAERASRAKDEFLAMLGHELRNPLAPIVTALEVMRHAGDRSRAHEIIERQVEHLTRLVDDLLDVARIARGSIELRRQHLEIADVVQRAVEMARPLLEQRRSALSIAVPSSGLAVDGDAARLAQVVSNLLTNAAKYSDPERPIRVVAARVGRKVRLEVEDEGIGIEPALLDQIFEQFAQAPQGLARSQGGLGLGLAIVRNLVRLHGGEVSASSDGPGCGSRFVVELPVVESRVDGAAAAPAGSAAARPPGPARATRTAVLIVDDNQDAAISLAEILEARGFHVGVAFDGREALAVAEAFAPAVALVDLGLPVMDGFELARWLRSRLPTIRLIALTGYGQAADRARVREASFDDHLVKPASIDAVIEAIARAAPPVLETGGG